MSEDIFIDWGSDALIPEGEYQAVYVSHMTTNGTFGPKLKITFRIVSQGPYYASLIDGWYNLKGTGEKTGKRGKIITSKHSKFVEEITKLFQMKIRVNRISATMLSGHVLIIKVRTVKKNGRQKNLSDVLQYSTVDSMVCLLNTLDGSELLHLKPKPIPEPIPTLKSI
jgi:hypothetical protein